MRSLRLWTAKAMGFLSRKRQDREFEAEVASHMDLLTERFLRQGMSRAEATTAARRQFGNIAS